MIWSNSKLKEQRHYAPITQGVVLYTTKRSDDKSEQTNEFVIIELNFSVSHYVCDIFQKAALQFPLIMESFKR